MGFVAGHATGFVLAAGERNARVDAAADAVHISTADGVARTIVVPAALVLGHQSGPAANIQIVGVADKSVAADARGAMSIGNANGVGAALVAGAGVHAAASATVVLGSWVEGQTNLSGGAVQIVAAGRRDARVAGKAGQADAFAVAAGRVLSALDSGARIAALGLAGRDGHAHHERIAGEPFVTAAVVASGRVDAGRVGSASVAHALVDV